MSFREALVSANEEEYGDLYKAYLRNLQGLLSLFSTLGQFQFPGSTLTVSRGPNLPQDGLAAVLNL